MQAQAIATAEQMESERMSFGDVLWNTATGTAYEFFVADFVNCYEDPNILDCGAAAASLIPGYGKLGKAASVADDVVALASKGDELATVADDLAGITDDIASGADDVATKADDSVSLSLNFKPGWTSAQQAAADTKIAALNDAAKAGELRVTTVQRSGTSASSRYQSAGGAVPPGADVDHTIDLQLGGLDDIANMSPLDASVNRSLGSQIMWQLRGVEPGTCVVAVGIC